MRSLSKHVLVVSGVSRNPHLGELRTRPLLGINHGAQPSPNPHLSAD
jgi:hypothetical protein